MRIARRVYMKKIDGGDAWIPVLESILHCRRSRMEKLRNVKIRGKHQVLLGMPEPTKFLVSECKLEKLTL